MSIIKALILLGAVALSLTDEMNIKIGSDVTHGPSMGRKGVFTYIDIYHKKSTHSANGQPEKLWGIKFVGKIKFKLLFHGPLAE